MKKTKAIIGVVVIFVMGVVCGALGDQIGHKMMLRKYESGERNYYQDIVMKDLTKKLNLDTVQREKVDKIVKEMLLGMLVVRRQYQPQYQQLIEKQRSEIRPLLRPDQLELYEKVIAHEQEKAQKRDRREELLVKSRQRPF
ncbi:MAG: hypothetical protein K4445_08375 [Deltaproteobacteria bacterium]|jgi:hypothetical protein|nr:hypothetical protein [Syntrophaceae bacterium]